MSDDAAQTRIVRVAVPAPLYGGFDYRDIDAPPRAAVGVRVLVPFGRRKVVGVILDVGVDSSLDPARLRAIDRVLDDQPVFDDQHLKLLRWAARYYHYPVGEALATALPTNLRRPNVRSQPGQDRAWQSIADPPAGAEDGLARAPKQQRILAYIRAHGPRVVHTQVRAAFNKPAAALRSLTERGLIAADDVPPGIEPGRAGPAPRLTGEQRAALAALQADVDGFAPALLEGVTGSGKTEVYFRRIADVLRAGRQVLLLAPEIGLTPQLIERVRSRFDAAIAVLHSQRADGQRAAAWRAAAAGDADILIGTRSAVFAPLPRLGLIIVDEEQDGSYKQQDGFRYHARDVALKRAQLAAVPIVLGSATPAFETLHNAHRERYRHLRLPERATGAALPSIRLLDVRSRPLCGGLSDPLLERIEPHLAAGNQVLIFINRRGFAPALCCHDCGWVAPCERCDAPLTLHRGMTQLQCHHCGAHEPASAHCPACGSTRLTALGAGTERVAGALRSRFPDASVARFDRDSMARKGRLEAQLADVASGATRLLVGTQMLAKGHDFARLTCVGVLDVDGGLFSADFRAPEQMAQLVTQVAGRAGRADRPGEVWLQTRHPEHPLLERLLTGGYAAFAEAALAERREAELPPYGHLALLRAEAHTQAPPLDFLGAAATAIEQGEALACWGPVPAPMPRRAGRYRAHLLLHATRRRLLHSALDHWQQALAHLPSASRVRWSIDVDPTDLL